MGERWSCAMLLGDYPAAWAESDRLLSEVRPAEFNEGRALHERLVWDGTPLAGKSVLVRCHHGLGDTIQFLRFLPALRSVASRVTILGQAPLLSFLEPLVDEALPLGTTPPAHEAEVEIMELAHALRRGPESAAAPYLRADREQAELWRRRLRAKPGFNVGVAWNVKGFKPERSLRPETLATLAGMPNVNFYCLQKFAPPEEQAFVEERLGFLNPEGAPEAISETAALVSNLDLVLTVDTMVAHLAGALGRPAWVLLHPQADWRWMVARADSSWYPSVRLFRQDAATNESSLVAKVRGELVSLATGAAS